MIFNKFENIKKLNYDVVIIGSGPAGLTLALELEQKNISSLIIEAGDKNFTDESQKFYEGKIIGDRYAELSVTRLRQYGGSSGHWGGVCRTLESLDFAKWPIKKDDLEIYSNQAKKILNLKRNNFYTKKFSNNFDLVKFEISPLRFRDKYYNQIKKSKYINLIINSYVLELYGEEKIDGLKFRNNKKDHFLSAKCFVLACGGIENSRLMLLIKRKNPHLINKEMPIGNYFLEHPYNKVAEAFIDVKQFEKYLNKKSLINDIKFNCDLWFVIAPNNKFNKLNNILESVIHFSFRYEDTSIYKKTFIKKLECVAPRYLRKAINENKHKVIIATIAIQTSQKLDINNSVKLNQNKKDPIGIDQPILYWKKSDLVRKTFKKNIEKISDLFLQENLGRIGIDDFIYSDESFENEGGGHHMGGTKMGYNKQDSVVDRNLAVHGIRNLFICGSSVFVTAGYANPTYTIVQLSIRLAEHLNKKITNNYF